MSVLLLLCEAPGPAGSPTPATTAPGSFSLALGLFLVLLVVGTIQAIRLVWSEPDAAARREAEEDESATRSGR